jgi:excisionase family DNA binding protein
MRMTATPKAPRINFHATRHSFATAMLESGATLQGVQKLMRHSDPRLTTEIYGHLAPSFLASELDQLDRGTVGKRGKGRARLARVGQSRASETDSRTAPPPAARASVTPLRRGPTVEVALDDLAAESSIKKASGMVEPRGIEPLTYALRMQGSLGGADGHRSQALASVDHFSPLASVSSSHETTPFATVSGALVTPVRRGAGPATHAGERGRDMPEQASPALASDAQDVAPVLLPVAEVAKRLRVSLKWVRYRIETGELPVVRVQGTRWRVRESDVEAFLARMQR